MGKEDYDKAYLKAVLQVGEIKRNKTHIPISSYRLSDGLHTKLQCTPMKK